MLILCQGLSGKGFLYCKNMLSVTSFSDTHKMTTLELLLDRLWGNLCVYRIDLTDRVK
ncbi:MAG: hypothetical protein ACI83D_000492 [Planctomycetota bacterium]|jgi:hypothetical protein